MSLHINLTLEAEHEIQAQKRRTLISASTTAVLCATLLGMLLYLATIVVLPKQEPPEITAYVKTDDDPPSLKKPLMAQRSESRPPSQTSNPSHIIVSSIPTGTPIASVEFDTPDQELSVSLSDTGTGWSGGAAGNDKGGFGGTTPGSTLEGTFYDFKQTQNGTPTNITPEQTAQLLSGFVGKRWREGDFARYFKAPTKLYASHFYISRRSANEAPKAYKVEDRVKDSRWCAVYRGKVVAPKSGKFRFVGAGDDNVSVRFNNDHVFDYGWYMLSYPGTGALDARVRDVMSGKVKDEGIRKNLMDGGVNVPPVQMYTYSTMKHWNTAIKGLAAGKTFEVTKGKVYPIEVLITEIPGGEFGAVLLIEEVGVPAARKDPETGAPILPLFRTSYSLPDMRQVEGMGNDIIPFDPVGMVWETPKK